MLSLYARAAFSVVAFAGAVIFGLRETDIWSAPDVLVVLSLCALGAYTAIEPVLAIREELRWRGVYDLRDHARRELDRTAVALANTTSIPIETLRVQALVVHRQRRLRGELALELLEESRLKSRPARSGVIWTKGKGVIGLCWKTGREVIANLDTAHNGLAGCTAEQWSQQPDTTTFGLPWEDFNRTVGKYGIIVAVPIVLSGPGFLGCVVVGGAPGQSAGLDTEEVLELVHAAADNIANHLRAPHRRAAWLTRLNSRSE